MTRRADWVVLVATRVPGVCIGTGVCLSGLCQRDAETLAADRNTSNADPNVFYFAALRPVNRLAGYDTTPARNAFEAHNAAELARIDA